MVDPNVAPSPDARLAAQLRGFGPLGIGSILVILLSGTFFLGNIAIPLGAVLVLVWVRWSRTPWRDIGYVRPQRWIATAAVGIAFGIALKFLMKAVVMPLLGADPVNQAYHFLAGNRSLLPAAIWAMLVAGFAEETVFRGYFFERFGRLFGPSVGARVAAVLLSSTWFGLAHYTTQGLTGVEHAAIVGLVFGTIYAMTRRIFLLMCAHSAFDFTALALIYWNLESEIAHFFFR